MKTPVHTVVKFTTGEVLISIPDLIAWLLNEKRNGGYSSDVKDFIDAQIERLLLLQK